jgi:hypothetical protein
VKYKCVGDDGAGHPPSLNPTLLSQLFADLGERADRSSCAQSSSFGNPACQFIRCFVDDLWWNRRRLRNDG